jgi:hypothetical protein
MTKSCPFFGEGRSIEIGTHQDPGLANVPSAIQCLRGAYVHLWMGHGPCFLIASMCAGVPYPLCFANPYAGHCLSYSSMSLSRVTCSFHITSCHITNKSCFIVRLHLARSFYSAPLLCYCACSHSTRHAGRVLLSSYVIQAVFHVANVTTVTTWSQCLNNHNSNMERSENYLCYD